jgi:hypothetical protein
MISVIIIKIYYYFIIFYLYKDFFQIANNNYNTLDNLLYSFTTDLNNHYYLHKKQKIINDDNINIDYYERFDNELKVGVY